MISGAGGRVLEKRRKDGGGCFLSARLALPYDQHLPAKLAKRDNRLVVTLLVP